MKSAILFPVVVVLVIVAAVALVKVTGVNPFQKPAEGGVVETAITKLLDTKTFKVNGRIEADVKSSAAGTREDDSLMTGISSVKLFVNVSSDVDQRKKDNLKTFSNINLGVDAEGMQFSGIIEAITTGSSLYIKLVSIPPMLTAFLGDIDSIKNQWIEIDLESIKEQYQEAANQAGIALDQEQVEQQLKDLIEEMKALFRGKTLFDITKELVKEEVNEISTEHYFVEANKDKVKEFILEYIELTKKYVPSEQKAEYDRNIQEAMQDFPEKFEEFWASIGGIGFDIWVEKRTGRLVRVFWQKSIDPTGINDMPEGIEGIALKLDFSFSDFNKRVDIEAPSGSKPFDEILSGIMSTFAPDNFEAPGLPAGF